MKQNISSPLVRIHSDPHRTVDYILTLYLVASTIKTLKAELAERQRELVRERQDSKKIRDELEQARDENAQTLEDLSAQNNKILETITLHHQEKQGSPGVSEEIERKLDSLCQSMSGLHQLMANPAALSEDVASLGRGITTQLATFFGDLGSRVSEIDCVQKQHSPIIDEIANACRAIDERMQSEDGRAAAESYPSLPDWPSFSWVTSTFSSSPI